MQPLDPQAISANLSAEGIIPMWLILLLVIVVVGFFVVRKINSLEIDEPESEAGKGGESASPVYRADFSKESEQSQEKAEKKLHELFPDLKKKS